ncbi:hypothetical protein BX591_103316 [Paraburkholderia bryophila]|jgi:hypothetical protein|uniref:Uncharacterized protein n=1 Tax=Paraburkholderia bryophila TaxID=420952 RepID=A0A329CUF5_9BURK|nr:hypothetical protein BX591_103316 [Paraburkholderia bryophila]
MLDRRRVRADRVVERQRTVDDRAADLAAIGHFAERGGVERRGDFRGDGFQRGQHRHFRQRNTQRVREFDCVAHDIGFLFQRRENIDGRVRDEQRLRIARHIHDENVTQTPFGADAGVLADHFLQQFIRVQAAFHQRVRCAGAHQFDGFRGGRVTMRRVDHAAGSQIDFERRRQTTDADFRPSSCRPSTPRRRNGRMHSREIRSKIRGVSATRGVQWFSRSTNPDSA